VIENIMATRFVLKVSALAVYSTLRFQKQGFFSF